MTAHELTQLTDQQGAILSAFTGKLCCNFSDFHKYAERKLGRPIFTHEFASQKVTEEIREASREDLLAILPESTKK
jgi:hypothetical protein